MKIALASIFLVIVFVLGSVVGFNYASYNAELVANTDTGYMISYAGITHYYDA